MALLVSGGHSSLLLVPDVTHDVRALGVDHRRRGGRGVRQGRAGARPAVPRRSAHRSAGAATATVVIDFPRGLTTGRDMERHRFDFSFSGLKTAVAAVGRGPARRRARRCRSPTSPRAFQEAVVDVLTRKAVLACREHGVDHLQIGGGVAANSRLRAMAQERCDAAGIELRVPRPGLCTDNGAMVAALGAQMVLEGRRRPTWRCRPTRRCRSPRSRPDPAPTRGSFREVRSTSPSQVLYGPESAKCS